MPASPQKEDLAKVMQPQIYLYKPGRHLHNNLRGWLHRRVRSHLPDAALSISCTLSPCDADVALVSPGIAPRVLYLPVFCGSIRQHPDLNTVSDNEHAVVEFLASSIISEDATLVVLKHWLVCFNSNGDWLPSHCRLEITYGLGNHPIGSHIP